MAQTEQCTIGNGVIITGRLTGDDEVIVQGKIEGTISLNNHLLIDESGSVIADVDAQSISVKGTLNGNVIAHNVVHLQAGCLVTGNIQAPRVMIDEGAKFKGNIDMDVAISNAE